MAPERTTQEVKKLLEEWYSVADASIPRNSVKFFAKNAVVQFNGMEPAVGQEAVQNFFQSVADLLEWQKRRSIQFDIVGNRIYDETEHTLVAKGDPAQKEVVIHQMNVYDLVPDGEPEMGKFMRWMAFTERGALFERIAVARNARREI